MHGFTESLPALIVHADWGSSPHKRWMARATWEGGRYRAQAPEPVGDPSSLFQRLQESSGLQGIILVGFDFPIGLPQAYAQKCVLADFAGLLPLLGQGEWSDFYRVAERPEQIHLRRPFYPLHPGSARQAHLLQALGVADMNALRRRCELARPGRRAAAPLFWTLGGQQVGKAAICGWRDLLAPALPAEREPCSPFSTLLWPFDGSLRELFRPQSLVVAETYPAEFYHHLGVKFPLRTAPGLSEPGNRRGPKTGKRSQVARKFNADPLFSWAKAAGVSLVPALQAAIRDGFGPSPDAEDMFDAAIGLFGMLNVILGFRSADIPPDPSVRRVEGWILGQSF